MVKAGAYPPPAHPTIVEPFAGAASYSMHYLLPRGPGKNGIERVVLFEKDPRVCELWWRLLEMEPDEVLAYPMPVKGERTTDFLVMTAAGSSSMGQATSLIVTDRVIDVFEGMLRRIARLLPHAKEKVAVFCADYRAAANIEATWFIDPPYQAIVKPGERKWYPRGMGYAAGCNSDSLDYEQLAEWCRERRGQRIVCEQEGATWLPFQHLRGARDTSNRQRVEVAWIEPEHQLAFPLSG